MNNCTQCTLLRQAVLSVGVVRVGPLEVVGSQGMLFFACLLILTSFGPSLAGHYLFWMPFGSKSMKIGVMDVVYELAEKGHTTTVVTAFKSKTEKPRVKEIVIDSDFVGLVQSAIGGILVKKGVDPRTTKEEVQPWLVSWYVLSLYISRECK